MILKKTLYRLLILNLLFLSSVSITFAAGTKSYNPQVESLLLETEKQIQILKNTPITDNPQLGLEYEGEENDLKTNQNCSTASWTSFQKSFSSYNSFVGDWEDVFRNDCLREDIWKLENKKQELNNLAVAEALRCNPKLADFKSLYQKIDFTIQGLRRYGENPDLEFKEGDLQNCPNCQKAAVVGIENLNFQYAASVYADQSCPLTQAKSQEWKNSWQKLKDNLTLFKNVKNLWQSGAADFSPAFTEKDYLEAQKNTSSWWHRTWYQFYSYNGKNLSVGHLRDGEDQITETERTTSLFQKALNAVANVLKPPTVEELAQEYDLQTEIYSELLKGEEVAQEEINLTEWASQWDYNYQVNVDAGADLENYLIDINNSVRYATEPLQNFTKNLRQTVSRHCRNLYGECSE